MELRLKTTKLNLTSQRIGVTNLAWHALMVTYVVNNIQSIQPMITAELFEEKKAGIFNQLHKIFKHYSKEYHDSNGITLTYGAKPRGKSSAQTTRWDGRKQMVSQQSNMLQ